MNSETAFELRELQQLLGARNERILQLERQVSAQREQWEADALEWRRLVKHRCDLAEWLIDAATNDSGKLIRPLIDAGLGGELFVPCTFAITRNGKRYGLGLHSTQYEIQEGAEDP